MTMHRRTTGIVFVVFLLVWVGCMLVTLRTSTHAMVTGTCVKRHTFRMSLNVERRLDLVRECFVWTCFRPTRSPWQGLAHEAGASHVAEGIPSAGVRDPRTPSHDNQLLMVDYMGSHKQRHAALYFHEVCVPHEPNAAKCDPLQFTGFRWSNTQESALRCGIAAMAG